MTRVNAASGFLAYQRPACAGDVPSGKGLFDMWESELLFRRFAQVVDESSSSWTLVSLLQIRMPSEDIKSTEPGHPAVAIGVEDGTDDTVASALLAAVGRLLSE
ncbi:hypothetical protein ColTof4_05041 [Colletotrichum tofieldiae]|nr:hypothetical protein ColTof3_10711 [Colletotrichum tofieldiae]GKT72618.1 hypothetical protein ColTof4_05041 [Colletotrichum tofieldiae]